MKYRKKPVVIEAVQWTGKNPREITELVRNSRIVTFVGAAMSISTLEGTKAAEPGDWIIRGVRGECYPVKDEIFRATYEPVDE